MPLFNINVIIENKPGINDPEGDTILNDLILQKKFSNVKKIKSAKMLKFQITAKNKNIAKNKIKKICDDLRIYNPMVSKLTIEIK